MLTRDAWRQLQDTVARDAAPGAQIHARVATGHRDTEIARIAAEIDADVIVVGVSRRDSLSPEVLGATAARVMRVADRPILAITEAKTREASQAGGAIQSLAA